MDLCALGFVAVETTVDDDADGSMEPLPLAPLFCCCLSAVDEKPRNGKVRDGPVLVLPIVIVLPPVALLSWIKLLLLVESSVAARDRLLLGEVAVVFKEVASVFTSGLLLVSEGGAAAAAGLLLKNRRILRFLVWDRNEFCIVCGSLEVLRVVFPSFHVW